MIAIKVGLLVFVGVKAYLFLNLTLGNDIIITLESDKSDISTTRGVLENISFEASVVTNPFCTAECRSLFEDVSADKVLDASEFFLKKNNPITKNYNLTTAKLGSGQELYRFTLECRSKSTTFCHTNEKLIFRSILVTVEYALSDEEENLKNRLNEQLIHARSELNNSIGRMNYSSMLITKLDPLVFTDELKTKYDVEHSSLDKNVARLEELRSIWLSQDYELLERELGLFYQYFFEINNSITMFSNQVFETVNSFNLVVDLLYATKSNFDMMKNLSFVSNLQVQRVNDEIENFNFLLRFFNQRRNISEKKAMVQIAFNNSEKFYDDLKYEIDFDIVQKTLEVDINYDLLCFLNKTCIDRPGMIHRSIQNLSLKDACNDIIYLKEHLMELSEVVDKNLTTNNNTTRTFHSLKQNVINSYLSAVPDNNTNSILLKTVLENMRTQTLDVNFNPDLSNGLLLEIINRQPDKCELVTKNVSSVNNIVFDKISLDNNFTANLTIDFPKPTPSCCVFGECKSCCTSFECINDPSTFPVIFLHGHAFNKDTEYEYSLDAFNMIQSLLEDDGYLNAGAISLYTPKDIKDGVWGLSGVPISIKASYYFDVFEEPKNYIIVQTKSENIDTYVVRLKDIIDTIKFKTGKPKVKVVAHSMGGLVTRRYLQVFGSESVDRLIMVGTPNKGIRGSIADYCTVTGETLECRDMNADSLFLNKLNRGSLPNIKIFNIVGTGCQMKQGLGDGVVLEQDAILDGATNLFVNGSCKTLDSLHIGLLEVDKYPQVYSMIEEKLAE
ncbi:MAG: alpha/beta fold hydrolase [Nanoarchaeota archaeon]|nr:alpha/beta fold hydrolase [Nanoarchaeota archaeon]MBU2442907.1 alpha/beta fold hydrolase [Nanoarchaeota archaeon]